MASPFLSNTIVRSSWTRVQNDTCYIRGGIRTRDLLLRRQTRYPLRYTDSAEDTDGTLVEDNLAQKKDIPRSLVG